MRMETGIRQDHLTKRPIGPLSLSMVTTKFNQKDIDHILLKERATTEWKKITFVGRRTPHKVLMDCYMGQCVELYLMQYCGFINNPNDFYDVLKPDGITEVECKVTEWRDWRAGCMHHLEKKGGLDERRFGWGYGIADKVYFWSYDKITGDYTFVATATANNDLNRYVLDHQIML